MRLSFVIDKQEIINRIREWYMNMERWRRVIILAITGIWGVPFIYMIFSPPITGTQYKKLSVRVV